MTHCRSSLENPRSRCALGSAMFTIVRSSTIMSCAVAISARTSHRRSYAEGGDIAVLSRCRTRALGGRLVDGHQRANPAGSEASSPDPGDLPTAVAAIDVQIDDVHMRRGASPEPPEGFCHSRNARPG